MANEVSVDSIRIEPSRTFATYWAAPILGALAYPGMLSLFSNTADAYRTTDGSFVYLALAGSGQDPRGMCG